MLLVAEREQLPVSKAKAGDPAAWDTLFKRYQLPLYAYVFELIHDEQSSLDVVQETFISAARYIGGLRDDEKFGSWLFGIAHQKCVQRWRRHSREKDTLQEIAAWPEIEDGPADVIIRQEQEAEFMELLNQLPPPQRSVLLLHFLEDFSIEDISAITGAQPGTVKSRLHYAKRALRKLLEEKSNEDSA